MKIYVVTTGEWNEYCVDRVFTDREKAKDYVDWLGNGNVEELDADEEFESQKVYQIKTNLWRLGNNKSAISVKCKRMLAGSAGKVFGEFKYVKHTDSLEIDITSFVSASDYDDVESCNAAKWRIEHTEGIIRTMISEGRTSDDICEFLSAKNEKWEGGRI